MSTFTTGRARHLVKTLSPLVENFVAFARTLAFRKQPAQLFLNPLEPGGARTRIDLNDLGELPEREHAFEQAIYWLAWCRAIYSRTTLTIAVRTVSSPTTSNLCSQLSNRWLATAHSRLPSTG